MEGKKCAGTKLGMPHTSLPRGLAWTLGLDSPLYPTYGESCWPTQGLKPHSVARTSFLTPYFRKTQFRFSRFLALILTGSAWGGGNGPGEAAGAASGS